MSVPLFQADAFTSQAFSGNPAAVVFLGARSDGGDGWPLDDATMTRVAAEMNLSETAYVTVSPGTADPSSWSTATRFRLRWFTPAVEVSLCGHATLATAALLFYHYKNQATSLIFDTLSGPLVAERDGERGVAIFLPTFEVGPIDAAGLPSEELSAILRAALGPDVAATPGNKVMYAASRKRILVHLDDDVVGRAGLERITPDHGAMRAVHDGSRVSSVTVTTRGNTAPYDFCSRHFSPWIGIPEDPVTGSAHSYITTYWRDVLGKKEFFARQCSPRGGDLKLTILEDGRLRIVGETVIVFEATLFVDQL